MRRCQTKQLRIGLKGHRCVAAETGAHDRACALPCRAMSELYEERHQTGLLYKADHVHVCLLCTVRTNFLMYMSRACVCIDVICALADANKMPLRVSHQ